VLFHETGQKLKQLHNGFCFSNLKVDSQLSVINKISRCQPFFGRPVSGSVKGPGHADLARLWVPGGWQDSNTSSYLLLPSLGPHLWAFSTSVKWETWQGLCFHHFGHLQRKHLSYFATSCGWLFHFSPNITFPCSWLTFTTDAFEKESLCHYQNGKAVPLSKWKVTINKPKQCYKIQGKPGRAWEVCVIPQ
jgi:hypothetical protein